MMPLTGRRHHVRRTALSAYGLAIGSVAVATWVRLLLDPWLDDRSQYATLLAAVVFTGWYGGIGPILAALACGAASAAYFLLEPRHSFAVQSVEDQVGLLLYAAVGLASALVLARLRRAGLTSAERTRRFAQAVLDTLPVHVAVLDGAGTILAVNEAWTAFAGENGGSVRTGAGVNYLDVAHDARAAGAEDGARVEAGLRAVLSGASPRFTLEYPCPSPLRERWFLMLAVPLRVDSARCVVAHVDITERKAAEDRLRRDEDLLRTAFEASRMGWWEWRVADDQIVWSPHVTEIFGVTSESFGGKYEGFLRLLHPDDRERVDRRVATAIENDEPYEVEFRTIRPDGSVRWALVRGRVYRDADGRPVKMLGIDVDITRRKHVEEALRASQEELRQIDRNRSEFLATLAHELRSPLAPIRNALHVMTKAGGDETIADRMRALIDRQSAQISRLVDDLLDVSRIGQGKIELRKVHVDLATVVRDALDAVRPLIETMRHELTTALPQRPAYVEGDPARLTQVVANLLNNAAKYTREGGRIGLTLERESGQAVIRVSDTGVGIPAEMLPRVFDVYSQVAQHRERRRGGLGLGLTLVKRLVEMHGGSVEVQSAGLDEGSTFTVRLPSVADDAARACTPVARALS